MLELSSGLGFEMGVSRDQAGYVVFWWMLVGTERRYISSRQMSSKGTSLVWKTSIIVGKHCSQAKRGRDPAFSTCTFAGMDNRLIGMAVQSILTMYVCMYVYGQVCLSECTVSESQWHILRS